MKTVILKTPKLKTAEFNPETGISTVVITTDRGEFTGTSKLWDADKPYASQFAGCDIAERRANIKYIKCVLKEIRASLKALNDLNSIYESKSTYDRDCYEGRKLRRMIHEYKEDEGCVSEMLKTAQENIQKHIKLRDETLKTLIKWSEEDKKN